jgi:hypothetical protein
VQPFPALDRKWRISPDGGTSPRWRRDGKELFYVSEDQTLMAVTFVPESPSIVGATTALFRLRAIPMPPTLPRQQYAVTGAGDRVLVNTVVELPRPSPVTVVLDPGTRR